MMKFLRSQSQTVLILILAFICVGFFFYGNSGMLSGGGAGPTDFGRIDGENLSVSDLYGAIRNMRNLTMLEGRDQEVSQAQIAQEAWQQLLALHEADKLHIDVSDAELLAYIQGRPEFQKNGVYDPTLYRTAMTNLQDMRHIAPDAYAGLLHDELRTQALYRTLFSSIRSIGADVQSEYQKQYGPVQISYVTFPAASFAASAQVTPQDIEAAYKANPMNPAYRTDEKRQVEYVLFSLSADQMKLADKDKNAAIQALGDKAVDFAQSLEPDEPNPSAANASTPPPADFQAEAKKRNLTPITSNFFPVNTPPAGMPPSPAFNNAAFALTKEDAISKPVQLDNGVVVMHLVQIQPSELRPLADVTPAITKELQQQKGAQAQEGAAAIASALLRADVKKGTDFKTAAAAQHLTVQTIPAFVPRTVSMNDMKQATLGYFAAMLPVGAVSQPIPLQSDNSVLVLHVDSRAAADPTGMADFETHFRETQDQQLRGAAFLDWANWQSKQPGTHRPPNLDAYGAVD
jgi:peptidyl-prolyl cis-trans isomerase D